MIRLVFNSNIQIYGTFQVPNVTQFLFTLSTIGPSFPRYCFMICFSDIFILEVLKFNHWCFMDSSFCNGQHVLAVASKRCFYKMQVFMPLALVQDNSWTNARGLGLDISFRMNLCKQDLPFQKVLWTSGIGAAFGSSITSDICRYHTFQHVRLEERNVHLLFQVSHPLTGTIVKVIKGNHCGWLSLSVVIILRLKL